MRMNAYRKDILRTITHGMKKFLSIMVITALGVVMLTGLRAACVDLRNSADAFYDQQNLFDIMIQSTLGLTDDDMEALAALEGVGVVEGAYSETVYLVGETHASVAIKTFTVGGLNEPYVVEGTLPSAEDEIAVTESYLNASGKSIGDTVTIEEIFDDDDEEEEEEEATISTSSLDIDIDTSSLEEEEEEPTFVVSEFTITAIVVDPADINNPDGSTSFRNTSTTDYTFFVTWDAIDSDVYTAIYLTVDGAIDLECYDDEYDDAIQEVMDEIEAYLKSEREAARTEDVKSDAYETIAEAEETMNEAFADVDEQIAEGESELADGRQELDDGWDEYYDGLAQIQEGQAELDEAKETLTQTESDTYAQIEAGEAALEAAKSELDAALAEIEEGQAELDEAKETLTQTESDTYAQIETAETALETAKSELEATLATLEAQLETVENQFGEYFPSDAFQALRDAAATSDYSEQETALKTALSALGLDDESQESICQLAIALGQIDAGLEEIEAQAAALAQQKALAESEFASAWQTIEESQAELDEALAQIEAGYAEIEAQVATLAEQKALAESEFASAWQTIEENQAELDEALATLLEAYQELLDGEDEYWEGYEELLEGIEEYETQKADALSQLEDAKAEVDELDDAIWYVQDRSSLSGYSNILSDSGAIEAIGNAFPVVFLLVAILISLTTITRMVEEERGLIGLYKALGYTDGEVRRKYMVYALAASVLGSIIGLLGGFILLPWIVFIVFGVLYLIPSYSYSFDLFYGILGPAIFILGVCVATWWACRQSLKQNPAILMRPKAPKAGSKVLLEKVTFLWKRLSFLNKVTARNLFRYKKRLFMTVIGILGCTALLVCGFAIKDSVSEFDVKQYEEIYQYDVIVVASDYDDMMEMIEDEEDIVSYLSVRVDSVSIQYGDDDQSVTLYVVPDENLEAMNDYINLMNTDDEAITLSVDGVYITRNAGNILGFSEGDTVTLQDLTLTQGEVEVTCLLQNYLGNNVFMSQSMYESIFGEYEANGVFINMDESVDTSAWAEELSHEEGITSATSSAEIRENFSSAFALINMVVYIIITLAAALAFVVLFTLSITNISERERELATIKVLGFYDHEVHLYVNKETMILTILGILPGLIVGTWLGHLMTSVLNMPSIYFAVSIYPISYVYSAGLAVLFAIIVQFITNRILDKINPVEALKSVE